MSHLRNARSDLAPSLWLKDRRLPTANLQPLVFSGWDSVGAVRGYLLRYRVMAYVVGTLLIVLILVGVPLKYFASDGSQAQDAGEWITTWLGVLHGYLYMIFLVTAILLARRARFPFGFALGVMLLGTIPILSFWGEHLARTRVKQTHPEAFAPSP
jgi:integral membrane protein